MVVRTASALCHDNLCRQRSVRVSQDAARRDTQFAAYCAFDSLSTGVSRRDGNTLDRETRETVTTVASAAAAVLIRAM